MRIDQFRMSIILLIAILAAWFTVGVLGRNTTVIMDHVAREQALWRETNGFYLYDGGYVDSGDMILLGELFNGDYSRGGVTFIGSSETRNALTPAMLPEPEQQLIHNYAIGDLRHREIEGYIHMLVEQFGLLEAGGDRNTVILTAYAPLARPKYVGKGADKYVSELFGRHGLYSYDWKNGIHYNNPLAIKRLYKVERDLDYRFLSLLFDPPKSQVAGIMSMEKRQKRLPEFLGRDWKETMREEVKHFERTLDYLQAHGARVLVLRPPMGTWLSESPNEKMYRELTEPLLEARNIAIVDYSDILSDDEFSDNVHLRYSGHAQLQALYRELALEQLEGMGVSLSI